MPAADGVDARARRVAARLLPARSRRSVLPARHADPEPVAGPQRRAGGAHPAGAARVARALTALGSEGWVSLGRARRPGAAALVIDHLAIGPGGVVLVDSRAWVGRIEVSRGVVQQNGFWRERETATVAAAAGSVAALLPPRFRSAVHAVVCIAQHDLPEHVVAPGVHVVGVSGLAGALRSLPRRLEPAEVLQLFALLRQTLVDGDAPDQLTTAELDDAPADDRPGAHREPGGDVPDLFVPFASSSLRSTARAAARSTARTTGRSTSRRPGRRGAGRPWWRTPPVAVPRVLLAALLLAGAVVAGPRLAHSALQAVTGGPVSTVLPSGRVQLPAPGEVDSGG